MAISASLDSVLRRLLEHPGILHSLSFASTSLFYRLALCLKERLLWRCSSGASITPARLPSDVARFLASALNVTASVIEDCWAVFGDIIWFADIIDEPDDLVSKELLDIFDTHGAPEGIFLHDLYPARRTCLDPACAVKLSNGASQLRPLEKMVPTQCVRFTRNFGPVNAVCYSAHCRSCNTRYYPTYYVHESGALRTHYPGVPNVLHVQKHSFVDTSLCEHFTFEMVCAWVSGGNNAQIYNLEHRFVDPDDPRWHTSPLLTGSLVWNSFFTLALSREADENGVPLVLPNAESLDVRLDGALRARNWRMAGTGQENWNHACSLCCQRFEEGGKKYYLRAVVTDGVTVGRPCCGVHDCQGQLPTLQHRFCAEHESLENQCCVEGCEVNAEEDYMTCSDPAHRALEQVNSEVRSAMFQLKKRLERYAPSATQEEEEEENNEDDDVEVDAGGECTGKSEPKGPRARFGRRRTYCEQLCVASCGTILGRATFYGSEAISGVRMFLHALFPKQRSLPRVIFYDNACSLKRHLDRQNDHWFDACGLPVDVFHMKSKHKESDELCGTFCNPARFPELIEGGRWRFNSSAAEMINAWFGKYLPIARQMRAHRYDFFLDEMIKQKNRILVADLQKRGLLPWSIPRDWMLSEEPV